MTVVAHEPSGFEGSLVNVEVDIRRGIPGVDLVGLAAGAVKEARERVRAAIRNSGFEFPLDRVLISLAPADLPKEGAAYDLPMALALLGASGALPEPGRQVLAMGELRLDGTVHPVRGVLPAIAAALSSGIGYFIVPGRITRPKRGALGRGLIYPISRLADAVDDPRSRSGGARGTIVRGRASAAMAILPSGGLRRGAFRAQGAGRIEEGPRNSRRGRAQPPPPRSSRFRKDDGCQTFYRLLPDLREEDAVQVASLYSLSGLLGKGAALPLRPPFRAPHHSASLEGMIGGGGRRLRPGEISLAHKGVLFLDEAAEFG